MSDDQVNEYRWRLGDEVRGAAGVSVSYRGETWWDRTVPRVAAWLMYGVGVVLTGEHVWNFFRYYGELSGRSFRSTGERYAITLFMFLFAALIPTTAAAMRGNVGANVAVLTYVVARLLVALASTVSLADLIEFAIVCAAFGALCQRAVEAQEIRDRGATGGSLALERLEREVDTLRRAGPGR